MARVVGNVRSNGYNKRNPKKGIESQTLVVPTTLPSPTSYNKRNPKKGIERLLTRLEEGKVLTQDVTTKEIPKRELRDLFHSDGRWSFC